MLLPPPEGEGSDRDLMRQRYADGNRCILTLLCIRHCSIGDRRSPPEGGAYGFDVSGLAGGNFIRVIWAASITAS